MSKYIVVSYKPNSDDYCRGCHMVSYESDFQIEYLDDALDIVEHISRLDSTALGVNEKGYEHEVISINDFIDGDYPDFCYEYAINIKERTEELIRHRVEEEKRREAEKNAQRKAEQEERERSEYKRLSNKFSR
jgi:hypothetical protein